VSRECRSWPSRRYTHLPAGRQRHGMRLASQTASHGTRSQRCWLAQGSQRVATSQRPCRAALLLRELCAAPHPAPSRSARARSAASSSRSGGWVSAC
jgi:hypothetical protein